MSGLKRLVHEIHRRSLWQVLGIYLAASWIVFEAAQTLTEGMGLPDWVPPVALVLLLIGLPIVIATAFVQEGISPSQPPRAAASVDPATERPDSPDRAEAGAASEAPTGSTPSPAAAGPGRGAHHRLFTWRNALLGGGAAFAVLGVAAVGYMLMRTLGIGPAATLVAQGVLEERERIIVADFTSATGDSSLANVVTEAVRVDLSQSPVVVLVDRGRVATILGRMGRTDAPRLDLQLAREVAQRDGIKAVLGGQVDAAGSGYVLSASLVAADGGETLVSARESAGSADEVIEGIDKLSKRLRERIGESLRSIRRTPSLEQVTTPSLEALRYYTQAERAALMEGDDDRAIALLEEAVEVDTAFAMAWRKLGVLFGNRGEEPSRARHALERAVAHTDRLPDRERFLAQGSYYQQATGEVEKAIAAYENLLAIDPNASFAIHNLGVAYAGLRDHARSEELNARALAVDSAALSLANLVRAQANQGGWDEASATLARFERQFPENPFGPQQRAQIAAALGDYEAAREAFETLQRSQAGNLYWTAQARLGLASVDATIGRLREAGERFAEARASAESRDLPAEAIRAACYAAFLRILVAGDREGGVRILERALGEHPIDEVDPLDRPYLDVAGVYAVAGLPREAQEVYDAFAAAIPSRVQSGFSPANHWNVAGEIALARGEYAEAEEAFRKADVGYCMICSLPGLARAQEGAGRMDEAIATYERYLETPYTVRLGGAGAPFLWSFGDWLFLGPIYERLGQLYDERGDLENATEYYARFTELWAEADPELQPRVQAARERLEEIVRERG